MNNKTTKNDDLDNIEEQLKEKDKEEEKTMHKVSGKSVFELQEIIIKKSEAQNQKSETIPTGRRVNSNNKNSNSQNV
jgi:hypothetical protein